MILDANVLELRFGGSPYGLSARRLWEHTELGQCNVFPHALDSAAADDPSIFIDVVQFDGEAFLLTGLTLAELVDRQADAGASLIWASVLLGQLRTSEALQFVDAVARHLRLCQRRQATRTQQAPFMPSTLPVDVLGVPCIFSMLQRRIRALGQARAGASQWLATIQNLQGKGVRAEEIERSQLIPELAALDDSGEPVTAVELAQWCCFREVGLSVIPVVRDAQRQIRFTSVSPPALRRTRLPKAQPGQVRAVVRYDPALGYRIEQIEHETLWGPELHWQAVTFEGHVIQTKSQPSLMPTAEAAAALAARHALTYYPKRVALGRWSHIAWSGGEDYREWLITLPHYPGTFFSSHFSVRNVLAHIRCDVRHGADDERVLVVQEVQSDWAQIARRQIASGALSTMGVRCPPFLKEWPALAMKLVLLHGASQGLDAVAWTRGRHQVDRYNGLGAAGLMELYDRTLPREVQRMMKPHGVQCETLGVFVPANFRVQQSEEGYEVYSADNRLLATMPTLEDARQFLPDGAHELLYEVHGVRLSAATRKAILLDGFPAWG